jgi:hypothetical protein
MRESFLVEILLNNTRLRETNTFNVKGRWMMPPAGTWLVNLLVLVILSVLAYYFVTRTLLEAVILHHYLQ